MLQLLQQFLEELLTNNYQNFIRLQELIKFINSKIYFSDKERAFLLLQCWREDVEKIHENNLDTKLFFLGISYEYGIGTEKDIDKAINLYKEAVCLGNSNAMYALGVLYKNENIGLAIEFFKRAVCLGNSNAMYALGVLYKNENIGLAIEFFKKAAYLGNNDAINKLMELSHTENKKIELIIEWYTSAAEQHNSNAMNKLGHLYEYENKNIELAIEWYKKSAVLGNSYAMNCLGEIMYYNQKDYDLSIKWFKQAADLGNRDAMYNLWYLYKHVKKNMELAIEWSIKSIALSNKISNSLLKFLQDNGEHHSQVGRCLRLYIHAPNDLFYQIESNDLIFNFHKLLSKKENDGVCISMLLEYPELLSEIIQFESIHFPDIANDILEKFLNISNDLICDVPRWFKVIISCDWNISPDYDLKNEFILKFLPLLNKEHIIELGNENVANLLIDGYMATSNLEQRYEDIIHMLAEKILLLIYSMGLAGEFANIEYRMLATILLKHYCGIDYEMSCVPNNGIDANDCLAIISISQNKKLEKNKIASILDQTLGGIFVHNKRTATISQQGLFASTESKNNEQQEALKIDNGYN